MDNQRDVLLENPGKELNNPESEVGESKPTSVEYLELETKPDPNDVQHRHLRTDLETEEYKIIAKALQGNVEDEPPLEKSEAKFKPLLEIGSRASTSSSSLTVKADQTDNPSSKTSTTEHHDSKSTEGVQSVEKITAEEFQEKLAKLAVNILQEKIGDKYEPNDGRHTGQFFREVGMAEATNGQAVLPGIHSNEGILNEHRQKSGNWPCEIFQGLDVNECARTREILLLKPLFISDFSKSNVNEELVEAANILLEALTDEAKQNAAKEEPFHYEEGLTTWVESLCEKAFDEHLKRTGAYAENPQIQDDALAQDKASMSGGPVDKWDQNNQTLFNKVLEEWDFLKASRTVTTKNLANQNNEQSNIYQKESGLKCLQPDSSSETFSKLPVYGKIIAQSDLPPEGIGLGEQHPAGASGWKCSYLVHEYHNQHLQQKKMKLNMEENFSASWEDCSSTLAKQRSSDLENRKEGDDNVAGSLSDFENGSVEVLDIVEMCNCDGNEHICNSFSQYRKS